MRLEEKSNEARTLAWASKTRVTQGEFLCVGKKRCVAAARMIKPRNRIVVGRLRGMCEVSALHAYRNVSPSSAGRGLPHNLRRGDWLGTRQPTLRLSRRTDPGPSGVPSTNVVCCPTTPFGDREVH